MASWSLSTDCVKWFPQRCSFVVHSFLWSGNCFIVSNLPVKFGAQNYWPGIAPFSRAMIIKRRGRQLILHYIIRVTSTQNCVWMCANCIQVVLISRCLQYIYIQKFILVCYTLVYTTLHVHAENNALYTSSWDVLPYNILYTAIHKEKLMIIYMFFHKKNVKKYANENMCIFYSIFDSKSKIIFSWL